MNLQPLQEAGIDTAVLCDRLMEDEQLLRFMERFVQDETFARLTAVIAAGKLTEAVAEAHSLKGMTGNLAMNLLHERFSQQVWYLRNDQWDAAAAMMEELTLLYHNMLIGIQMWLQSDAAQPTA